MYYMGTKIICNVTKDDTFILTMIIISVSDLDSSWKVYEAMISIAND